jgi:hypothetical protein
VNFYINSDRIFVYSDKSHQKLRVTGNFWNNSDRIFVDSGTSRQNCLKNNSDMILTEVFLDSDKKFGH